MNARDRIRNLLAGKPIDRIPNGLGGCETAGLHVLAYDRLKGVLGVGDPRNRMTTFMTNALVEPSVLEAMEGDVILLSSRRSARAAAISLPGCTTFPATRRRPICGLSCRLIATAAICPNYCEAKPGFFRKL